jgi:hypothetical protein
MPFDGNAGRFVAMATEPDPDVAWTVRHMRSVLLREIVWAGKNLQRARPKKARTKRKPPLLHLAGAHAIPDDEGIVSDGADRVANLLDRIVADPRSANRLKAVDYQLIKTAVQAAGRRRGHPRDDEHQGGLGDAVLAVLEAAGLPTGDVEAVLKALSRTTRSLAEDLADLDELFKPPG